MILCCFLVVLKNLVSNPEKTRQVNNRALFVISCKNHLNFKLSEDDQVNISSRLTEFKYSEIEIWLYNSLTKKYFLFIPRTSENTFRHLIKIERENKFSPLELSQLATENLKLTNRIEMFRSDESSWRRMDNHQDNFDFIQLIDFDNELVSPFLIQYLLILICILIAFDLSFKYRILKI